MIPLMTLGRPTWLFGQTVHDGCDRGSYYDKVTLLTSMVLQRVLLSWVVGDP
jgi:Ni,Fe-hydrogenase I small subunit